MTAGWPPITVRRCGIKHPSIHSVSIDSFIDSSIAPLGLLGSYLQQLPSMAPDKKDEAPSPDSAIADPPPIHPSFIQVAKPYIFEQTIQKCIAAMGVNPLREESLRLQGVTWLDNIRRVLYL